MKEPSLTAHAFKRSYTDFHENAGENVKDLQEITRHSTAWMALRYARPDENRIRAAVGTMSERLNGAE